MLSPYKLTVSDTLITHYIASLVLEKLFLLCIASLVFVKYSG